MLGYSEENLDQMIGSLQIALSPYPINDDEDQRANLEMTMQFLQALWTEGHFSS